MVEYGANRYTKKERIKNQTKITDKLLKNDYYDFVGSDVHHQNHINAFNRKLNIKQTQLLQKVIEKNLFFLE
jgi:hypothetical protein